VIVDTSALLAVLLQEDDALDFAAAMETTNALRISAASLVEAFAVVDRRSLGRLLDAMIQENGFRIEPVTDRQARIAADALRRFGRGTGHPARLNFGDSFPYALAADMNEPLLFKGDDFSRTDVRSAL
jgi:ribonuclease VapC